MSMTIHVDIVSAEGELYSGQGEMVYVPAKMGEVGIAPRHTPFVSPIKAGDVRVTNGADVEQFCPKDEYKTKAAELRKKIGANGKIIMYAGNMDKINGLEDLAKIIPQIIRERRDICFIFVGQRPQEKSLTALSEEYPQNVKFLPTVPYKEMPAYYQMCDLML